jgi:hypothetical protein
MKKTLSPQEWISEFSEFISADSIQPPKHLNESVTARVHQELNPSSLSVFFKLTGIHALVGTFTLLFCPQFGFALTSGAGLMGLFMPYGNFACMLGCGAVFMSGSLLVASLVLRPEEVRVIRKTEILQVTFLALLSIGALICVGDPIVASLALFWMLGSVLGGLGTFELGVRARGLSWVR